MNIGGVQLNPDITLGNILTLVSMLVTALTVKANIEKSQALMAAKQDSLEKKLNENQLAFERRLEDQSARAKDHEDRDNTMFATLQSQMMIINGNVQRMIGQFEGAQAAMHGPGQGPHK